MDSVPGWYSENMLEFIKDDLKHIYNKINEKDKSKLEVMGDERIKIVYSTFIEICLRINDKCIHPDLIWLKYNK